MASPKMKKYTIVNNNNNSTSGYDKQNSAPANTGYTLAKSPLCRQSCRSTEDEKSSSSRNMPIQKQKPHHKSNTALTHSAIHYGSGPKISANEERNFLKQDQLGSLGPLGMGVGPPINAYHFSQKQQQYLKQRTKTSPNFANIFTFENLHENLTSVQIFENTNLTKHKRAYNSSLAVNKIVRSSNNNGTGCADGSNTNLSNLNSVSNTNFSNSGYGLSSIDSSSTSVFNSTLNSAYNSTSKLNTCSPNAVYPICTSRIPISLPQPQLQTQTPNYSKSNTRSNSPSISILPGSLSSSYNNANNSTPITQQTASGTGAEAYDEVFLPPPRSPKLLQKLKQADKLTIEKCQSIELLHQSSMSNAVSLPASPMPGRSPRIKKSKRHRKHSHFIPNHNTAASPTASKSSFLNYSPLSNNIAGYFERTKSSGTWMGLE